MWKLNCTLGQEEAVSRTAVISRINTTMVLVRFYGGKRRGGLACLRFMAVASVVSKIIWFLTMPLLETPQVKLPYCSCSYHEPFMSSECVIYTR